MRAKSFRHVSAIGVLLLTALLTTDALAQGVVWFDNRLPPPPPDRRVFLPDGTPITGPAPGTNVSPYYAQLYYQNNSGAWVAHPHVARFFTSTANAGYWNGGSRTLVNAGSPAPGQTRPVQMQVVVWDGGIGTATVPQFDYNTARAQGRLWTTSQFFTYTEEWEAPRGTDDTYMKNFPGIRPLSEPPSRFHSVSRTNDQIRFYVQGGGRIAIETKTNLISSVPWLPIYTNFPPFWFTNSTIDAERRFFRAVYR